MRTYHAYITSATYLVWTGQRTYTIGAEETNWGADGPKVEFTIGGMPDEPFKSLAAAVAYLRKMERSPAWREAVS